MSHLDHPNPNQPNPQSLAFEVKFDENQSERQHRVPKHLQVKQKRIDKHDIDAKLQKAAEIKQLHEEQRLARIHARQEQCRKMATKMDMLLEQDAKRKGMEGTEHIPAMSRKQAAEMIRCVARDFETIGSEKSAKLTSAYWTDIAN